MDIGRNLGSLLQELRLPKVNTIFLYLLTLVRGLKMGIFF